MTVQDNNDENDEWVKAFEDTHHDLMEDVKQETDGKKGTIANLRIGSRNNILIFKETRFI